MPVPQTVMQTCILGAWDFSVCSCIFLQGVLCAQFANYMTLNKRDSVWMKLFVAGLALLTTLKTLQSLMIMWVQNVAMFGDLEAGVNIWMTHWVWKGTVILEAATAFCVQMFFGRRLWAISRNAYLVITCVVLFLGGLVSSIVGIIPILTNPRGDSATGWVGAHLGVVLCGDLLLTGSTIFYLLSAAPAALCALINFIAVMKMATATWTPAPVVLEFIANMVLPQLYAWSAMWTLNSREEIWMDAGNSACTIHLLETSADSSNSETSRHQYQDHPDPLAKMSTAFADGTSYLSNELKPKPQALPKPLSSPTSATPPSRPPAMPLFTNHATMNVNARRVRCPEAGCELYLHTPRKCLNGHNNTNIIPL
ncbi:hypothetical protein DFH08DRAFT_951479 [Mycena albidolilacea]|uniref:Uncharacterized protein n=1 Tax=Mycena albidolilacea TaxID=1033008 RepID=A0AAD7F1G5_9AGAR|nr:hypothetical protein DFH08DRAFT_951479 [Mycena albidolilacea]